MTRFSKLKLFGGALALLAMSCAPMAAQSKTPTKQEQANLKMAMDWWRIGLVAAHPEAADKYLAENLIQHNPNFPQGR
jgi:ABC-type glycerol-3-phosphate transport system substrate-binding protein